MQGLVRIARFILNHPLTKKHHWRAFIRFFKWQLGCWLHPYPVVYPFIEDSKLLIEKGMTGATGNIYVGLHEFTDMAFLLHFMHTDELFVDIGANVGEYTVLAAAVAKARTIAFEPIPATFEKLRNNIFLNRLETRVDAYNIGIGSRPTMLRFTKNLDTVNHVLAEGEVVSDVLQVPVETLDNMLSNQEPTLLKIDVEGFEQEVLNGAGNILCLPQLQAIIIELNGSGGRYGFNDEAIHQRLLSTGFSSFQYEPFSRILLPLEEGGKHGNTIYIKDIEEAKRRVSTARKFTVLGQIL